MKFLHYESFNLVSSQGDTIEEEKSFLCCCIKKRRKSSTKHNNYINATLPHELDNNSRLLSLQLDKENILIESKQTFMII